MGNRLGTKRKNPSDGSKNPEVKRRPKKNDVTAAAESKASPDQKVISCPDVSDVGPSGSTSIDVKIYRSYSNVSAPADKRLNALAGPSPDIRVYRRNTGSLSRMVVPDRSQTLPKSFGRNRSAASGSQSDGPQQSNGSLPRDGRTDGDRVVRRRSTLGSGSKLGATKESRRTGSTASVNSIGYKVNPEDFPDTTTIKRKLTFFEMTFVRNFVDVFCPDLSDETLLPLLSIAIRPDRANQQVSLLHYLQSKEIPANLHDPGSNSRLEYILTIPQVLFKEIFKIKQENIKDTKTWIAVGRHILSCQAMEAANELSRVFEYQLSLLPEGLPVELLCRHSAQCVHEFLKRTGGHLDRNSIVHGVVRGNPRMPQVCPKFSVVLGERELKWNLFDILKKPGLRKEMHLLPVNEQIDVDQTPWRFFTSLKVDPMLYGYRGLIVDWDFASATYRLNAEDANSFPEELDWRPDDFHRDYSPYRRLVGLTVMRDFCAAAAAADRSMGLTLGDYVRKIQGRTHSRDRVQPVYRPLGDGEGLRDRLPLESVNLGNADTLRLRKGKHIPDTATDPKETDSNPQRTSGPDDVVLYAVPNKKRTPAGSTDASPALRSDVSLSPVSTISLDSQRSNKMRYKNGPRQTGSPEYAGSRRPVVDSKSRHDDSADSGQTEDSPRHSGVQVTEIQPEETEPVVSDDATGTTSNGSVDVDETDFVQTPSKQNHVVYKEHRIRTITSDV